MAHWLYTLLYSPLPNGVNQFSPEIVAKNVPLSMARKLAHQEIQLHRKKNEQERLPPGAGIIVLWRRIMPESHNFSKVGKRIVFARIGSSNLVIERVQ